jgi:hypothetical protein
MFDTTLSNTAPFPARHGARLYFSVHALSSQYQQSAHILTYTRTIVHLPGSWSLTRMRFCLTIHGGEPNGGPS